MTLANWITSSRFILAPLIYWQLSLETASGVVRALLLLLAAGMTDVLDGWAARARNEVSELGKTLDPLADKLVIFAVLLALAGTWELPWWLPAIYAAKEIFQVLAGVFLLTRFKRLIPSNRWGKASTCVFFTGFGLYFLRSELGIAVIIGALALSVYALYTYYLEYKKLPRD